MRKTKIGLVLIALLLAPVMMLGFMTIFAQAESGDISVFVTIQLDDTGLYMAKQQFTVEADLSERYGYIDAYKGAQATALDALVAAHIAMFGDEDLEEWLKVDSSGTMKLLAGEDAQNSYFFVNGAFAIDEETGFGHSVSTATLADDDKLLFYLIQDTSYLSDSLVWFADASGNRVDTITVKAGEEFEVTLVGYMAMWAWYGGVEDHIELVEDAQIVILDLDDTPGFRWALFGEELGLTDDDGTLSITFDEPGTYILSAYDDSGWDMPFTAPWLEVTVTICDPIAYKTALNGALGWIRSHVTDPAVDSVGGEWAVLGLARAGIEDEVWYDKYLAALDAALADGITLTDRWTDFERVTLALTALGIDAADYNGFDLTELYKVYKAVADRPANSRTINADIFALIALDSKPYGGDAEQFVSAILAAEKNGGGWGLTSIATVDMTAMAIQALAPYNNEVQDVKASVERGIEWLDSQTVNDVEGNAQIIVALSALEIDAKIHVDALIADYDEASGGFKRGGITDMMATEQAAYALVAYDRFINDKNSLYDMSDAFTDGGGTGTLPVNKSALNSEIALANALKASDYTANTWEAMTAKLEAAIKISLKDNAAQAEVDTAKNALASAIAALVRDSGDTGTQQWIAYISVRDDNAKAGQTRVYFAGQNLSIKPGDTVYDLLVKTGLTLSISGHPAYGLYIEAINGFGEFDDGPLSGWMYKVNGEFPKFSCALYRLKDGDRVEWVYTRDLGDDIGGENSTGSASGTSGATPAQPLVGTTITEGQTPLAGANPFSDVKESDWFFEAVNYVYTQKLMNGTSDTLFSPNASLTRAMLVTILYRYEGEPVVTAQNPFSDVAARQWYTEAVIWANTNGIVTGYGNGKFGPTDNITREQFAAILYRYAQKKSFDTSKTTDLSAYTDAGQISAYALEAMKWANATDLIAGRTQTTLAPLGTATRAETAMLLMKFIQKYASNQ